MNIEPILTNICSIDLGITSRAKRTYKFIIEAISSATGWLFSSGVQLTEARGRAKIWVDNAVANYKKKEVIGKDIIYFLENANEEGLKKFYQIITPSLFKEKGPFDKDIQDIFLDNFESLFLDSYLKPEADRISLELLFPENTLLRKISNLLKRLFRS